AGFAADAHHTREPLTREAEPTSQEADRLRRQRRGLSRERARNRAMKDFNPRRHELPLAAVRTLANLDVDERHVRQAGLGVPVCAARRRQESAAADAPHRCFLQASTTTVSTSDRNTTTTQIRCQWMR